MLYETLIEEIKKENNLIGYNKVFDEIKGIFNVEIEDVVFWKKVWYYSGLGIEDNGEHIVFLIFISFLKKKVYVVKFYFEKNDKINVHLISLSELVIKKGENFYLDVLSMRIYFVESGNQIEITDRKEVFIQEIKEEIEKGLNELTKFNFQ
ncbi:MAG: hypothetical protein QXM53_05220 [Thermofilaceae archaeon]